MGFGGVLLLVVVLAGAIRITTLGREDYWLDELHALLNSAAHRGAFEALPYGEILSAVPRYTDLDGSSPGRVWRDLRHDSHPPVYFLLLYGWRRLVGDGELLVRLPSAIFSMLSLIPVALILREYGRPRAGVVAAGLLGLAYAHVLIGQQARPYSLALLLVAVSYLLLVVLERRGPHWTRGRRAVCWAAYAAAVALAMLTHYFAGLALLGQVVYAALRLRGALRRGWAISLALAGLGWALVWLPGFLAQWGFIAGQDWVADTAVTGHAWRTAVRALDLPVRLMLATRLPDWSSARVLAPAVLGGLLLLGAVWLVWGSRNGAAGVFLCWYLGPCVALTLLDLVTGKQLLTHLRYSSVATPGLVGLLVLAAGALRRPLPLVLAGIAVVAVALTLRLPAPRNPHAREAARLLQAALRPDDLLVFDAQGWIPYWARRDFVQVSYYMPHLDCSVLMLNGPPPAATSARLPAYERIFVVSPRIDAVPNPCPQTHELTAHSNYIHDIGWVYLFTRGGGTASAPGSRPGPVDNVGRSGHNPPP